MNTALLGIVVPGVAEPTATEIVFETVLADIVRGTYPPGARLPAERELARLLGASRPTLREALRRLTEWRLVEPRRGSGVVVRHRYEWSIEVLPAYLRYASPTADGPKIPQLLADLLALRRGMIREIVRVVAGRMRPGGTIEPRAAISRAWNARERGAEFVVEDFRVIRAVVEGADFLPAVWLLNRLSGIYLDIAKGLSGAMRPPENYVDAHLRFLDALEVGEADRAANIIGDYLESHDRRATAALMG